MRGERKIDERTVNKKEPELAVGNPLPILMAKTAKIKRLFLKVKHREKAECVWAPLCSNFGKTRRSEY